MKEDNLKLKSAIILVFLALLLKMNDSLFHPNLAFSKDPNLISWSLKTSHFPTRERFPIKNIAKLSIKHTGNE
jgi:hypothetical protein